MGLFDFNSQCPFTQSIPLALTGIPGIIYVLVLPFLLSLFEDSGNEVFTISHTARQPQLVFSFAQFFVLQILFMSACFADGVLIALYAIAFVLLAIIFICNPGPEEKGNFAAAQRITHVIAAFTFFTGMQIAGFWICVGALYSFDSYAGITASEKTARIFCILVTFLQLGSYLGMLFILFINRKNTDPDQRWPRTVSHLERYFTLFFFILLLLIPEGTLV